MLNVTNFKNKFKGHREKKEFEALICISILLFSAIIFFTYIKNTPILISDFPTIKIETESEPNYEDYVDCTFELDNCEDSDKVAQLKSKTMLDSRV